MAYGALPASNRRRNDREGKARMGIAYLIGTLGMGIVIAICLILSNAGWLDGVQSRLHHAESHLPHALQSRAQDLLDTVIGKAANIGQSTTTLLQRAGEGTQSSR